LAGYRKLATGVYSRLNSDHGIFKGNEPINIMRQKYGKLIDSIIYMPKVWYNLPDITAYINEYNKELKPLAYEMIFDNENSKVFHAIKDLNKSKVTVLAIALWDELCAGHTDEMAQIEGPDAAWGWLINNGANAIMTDNPEELIKYLVKRGLR
jgi:glycerophosphoryl diester phosphodiesterase